ncbi:hypothetical protein COE50_22120 [Bacillus anthracis]|nr:hypothetical protein COE50_22120 [Bacillus anthracis]
MTVVNELNQVQDTLTKDMWFRVDDYFTYETTVALKHLMLVIPFVVATFIGTLFLCSWLFATIKRHETLNKVSLLKVPTKGKKDVYYFHPPRSPIEVLESMCTFFVWKVLLRRKNIAFRDYKRARWVFRILLVIAIVTTLYGFLSIWSVFWYPHPTSFE